MQAISKLCIAQACQLAVVKAEAEGKTPVSLIVKLAMGTECVLDIDSNSLFISTSLIKYTLSYSLSLS